MDDRYRDGRDLRILTYNTTEDKRELSSRSLREKLVPRVEGVFHEARHRREISHASERLNQDFSV